MKLKISIIFALLTILTVVVGLLWLAVCLIFIYLILISYSRAGGWFKKNKLLNSIFLFIGIIVLSIFLKLCFVEIYKIPTGSMEDTILPGDRIVVNKLIYGPVMPRNLIDIPWINIILLFSNRDWKESNNQKWGYNRLNGITKMKAGDVMVTTFSRNSRKYFIKRCTALPGDIIQIINGKIYNNGFLIKEPPLIKHNYELYTNRTGMTLDRIQNLSRLEAENLIHKTVIDSVSPVIAETDTLKRVFPWEENYPWTIDNFGPFIIPCKGMTIPLTKENYILYQDMFDYHEDFKPVIKGDKFYVGDKEVREYTFRKNYYFMMGDNRHHSFDSRHRGVVPEEQIVGKAVTVIYSRNREAIQWQRIFKAIE